MYFQGSNEKSKPDGKPSNKDKEDKTVNEMEEVILSNTDSSETVTLAEELTKTILHRRSRSWGQSPTRMFVKNFP